MTREEAYRLAMRACEETWNEKTCKQIKEALEQEPKTGHCKDCKHFRKLPYHADTLGKCFNHTGFCPNGDWYCADFEPQESEEQA